MCQSPFTFVLVHPLLDLQMNEEWYKLNHNLKFSCFIWQLVSILPISTLNNRESSNIAIANIVHNSYSWESWTLKIANRIILDEQFKNSRTHFFCKILNFYLNFSAKFKILQKKGILEFLIQLHWIYFTHVLLFGAFPSLI